VEEIAHITHLALLRGQPIMLNQAQIAEMADLYSNVYGQR
jgi:hypothetical protein